MYTITLSNGTRLEGFTLKNNCLVRKEEITPAMLSGKLSPVTITGTKSENDDEDWGKLAGTHKHMQVAYIKQTDDGYALALSDIDNETWKESKRDSDIEYIAMMTGVKL